MKKYLSMLFCVFALLSGMVVLATAQTDFDTTYPRFVDMAGLLSSRDSSEIRSALDELSIQRNFDVRIVTTDNLENLSVRDYADTIYDRWGFGYGAHKDGILLLINMEERDWYISTSGFGITAFTDAGIDYIGEQIVPYLSDGDYTVAFETFVQLCDTFLTQAESGSPYDRDTLPRAPLSPVWIFVSILLGVIFAGIVVGVMCGKLKTVRPQKTANSYIKIGSMMLTDSRDLFLYRTVTKTPRPRPENHSGGSSVHGSSSGSHHGGGGGKF